MEVVLGSLLAGARAARGTVAIVDVYRAFTCTSFLFALGAERSFLVATPEEGLALKASNPDLILIGEVDGKPIPGFDHGNSPSDILRMGSERFRGRSVVQRTSAGVQGVLVAMEDAEEVLLGSYTTAEATAQYLRAKLPKRVSIVAMGKNMKVPAPEDEWCARYLAHLLGAGDYDDQRALAEIISSESTQKFLRRDKPYYPPEDPILCLQRNIHFFVLRASREGNLVGVQRV
jgi:2-phosphosulfolactate phosphatase